MQLICGHTHKWSWPLKLGKPCRWFPEPWVTLTWPFPCVEHPPTSPAPKPASCSLSQGRRMGCYMGMWEGNHCGKTTGQDAARNGGGGYPPLIPAPQCLIIYPAPSAAPRARGSHPPLLPHSPLSSGTMSPDNSACGGMRGRVTQPPAHGLYYTTSPGHNLHRHPGVPAESSGGPSGQTGRGLSNSHLLGVRVLPDCEDRHPLTALCTESTTPPSTSTPVTLKGRWRREGG